MPETADLEQVRPTFTLGRKTWSLEDAQRVTTPFRGPRRFGLDEPENMLGRWLREFRDERTGGSCPPPMH